MEQLFTTQLSQGGGTMAYRVAFADEQYHFTPDGMLGSPFALRREHDEWHAVEPLPEGLMQQAIAALEQYQLQQH